MGNVGCTHLKGKASWFLPFNKGWNDGNGNPPNPNGLKTDYLWKQVLTRDGLTDIIENYAQIVETRDDKTGRKRREQIWPRYHQLDVVRRLLADASTRGVGPKYLIQHSAGSGKSNSIAWLAHQLIGLEQDGKALFDSAIVVTDRDNYSETVTSRQFGPVAEPAPLPSPSTLVSNTGQSASATATITKQYAMEFTLGDHGQGYEISSVSIDLAAAPSSLTVSLWIGDHSVASSAPRIKLFDFENPASFAAGLNRFTAPAGVLAYQRVDYYIVLTDFGSSLSIKEQTSDNEDAVGEAGTELGNKACERALDETGPWEGSCSRASVLRLAVEGSRRDSGILVSTYAQLSVGDQEIISVGDVCCFRMGVGAADRYLIRGFSWRSDDTTPTGGGITYPWDLVEGSSSSGAKLFRLINTRNAAGITEWTAPQGATVKGGSSKTYTFAWDEDFPYGFSFGTRTGGVLTRITAPASGGGYDAPSAGVTVTNHGDIKTPYAPLLAILGEPLNAMTSNLGRADNGYVSLGDANAKVVSQGFSTGPNADGYEMLGIGVDIEGSAGTNGDPQVPSRATAVSVSVHAASGGKPGTKLFDLVNPGEFAPGHNFFEAPRGTTLDANTNYVMVWRYNAGTWHRLHRTKSDGEDSGSVPMFWVSDSYYRGADLENLTEDSGSNALQISVYGKVRNATGRPVVLASAQGAGILFADTEGIADEDGLPIDLVSSYVTFTWSYQWIRVDGNSETNVGANSASYQPVEADVGKLIKVKVSFTDKTGALETVTSLPFGPIGELAGPSAPPSTLVSNTDQSASDNADITQRYAVGFRLGDHGQGYEISSVSIELAEVPSSLTVSLWSGGVQGAHNANSASKLFDFANPSSFAVGLNEFTAPAGAFAYQNVNYFIVLSGFGASLSIKETTSDNEDAGGETGAVVYNSAAVRALSDTGPWAISADRARVLRLALEGWRRASGILASNYAQDPGDSLAQEIISVGDRIGFGIELGAADRYLIRGVSWNMDDTTPTGSGFTNPFVLRSGSRTGAVQFSLVNTRKAPGLPVWTAP